MKLHLLGVIILMVFSSRVQAADDLCSPTSVAYDLENKTICNGCKTAGPFFGIPRDNQDHLGTCYANAARNLMISMSRGKDIPSFMDLAALYKKKTNDFLSDGLDAGDACPALNEVKENGYCPEKFAPAEMGESNPLEQGLFRKTSNSITGQSKTLQALTVFLNDTHSLEHNNTFGGQFVKDHLKEIITTLKDHPEVKIPLPIVTVPVLEQWKFIESFHQKNQGKYKDEYTVRAKAYDEYLNEYQKFYPTYVDLIWKGKGAKDVFQAYQAHFKKFYAKYNLDDPKIWDEHQARYNQNTKDAFAAPDFKDDLKASKAFLAKTLKDLEPKENSLCTEKIAEASDFRSIKYLALLLDNIKQSPDLLFNGEKLKSDYEIMMLSVAPSCLSQKNRVKPSYEFTCVQNQKDARQIYNEPNQQKKRDLFRAVLYRNLKDGYAVGNNTEDHVNTVVGMRYDPALKSCTVKIRDSIDGTSKWINEDDIISDLQFFSEARPK